MKRLAVLLTVGMALPARGEAPDGGTDIGCTACTDATELVRMDGGYFGSDKTIECLACRYITQKSEAQQEAQLQPPPSLPGWVWFVAGVAAAGAAVFTYDRLHR